MPLTRMALQVPAFSHDKTDGHVTRKYHVIHR